MAVRMEAVYEGDLHCVARHGPSGDTIPTDAPADNRGKGRHFSPTDLLGAALGTCMLTTMAIAAEDRGFDMRGARADVAKEMSAVPRRHVSRLTVRITLPARFGTRERAVLEAAARTCPIHASLGPDTEVDLSFVYE